MKCKDCKAVCALRDQSSTGERECVFQAQIIARPDPIDWFNFRCVAAKDILGSIIANPLCNPDAPDKKLVTAAVTLADELIAQLKRE